MTWIRVFGVVIGSFLLPFLGRGCNPTPADDDTLRIETDSGKGRFKAHILTSQNEWDAWVVNRGSKILAWNFDRDAEEVLSAELGIYQPIRFESGALQERGTPVFVPLELVWKGESTPRHDAFHGKVADDLTGVPAGPAFVRVSYRKAGQTQQLTLSEAQLYYVPPYEVKLAELDIPIGMNLGGHTVQGTTFLNEVWTPFLPKYWQITAVHLKSDSGFRGTIKLQPPAAGMYYAAQGYRVVMPPAADGLVTMEYKIVGPIGLTPSWSSSFTRWGVLGAYTGDVGYGWPNPSGPIDFSPNHP